MTALDPATTLAAAAARLRVTADCASGTWTSNTNPFVVPMSPAVALALAALLEAYASEIQAVAEGSIYGGGAGEFLLGDFDGVPTHPALTLARLILEETP